jgi:ABC-type sulfate/molybdate transport systems ATPase subunit
MRSLLQRLLGELEIPAAHVTHDRDEALSIGDDLAIIVGGQLRQTGPVATVAASPADPDVARLLGWSELGSGTATNGTVHIGQIVFRDAAGLRGPVQAFYRPEDIELGPPVPKQPPSATLIAHIERIIHTRPLARVSLASDPPITALTLHRDIDRLRLTTGEPIQARLPSHSLRIFQIR